MNAAQGCCENVEDTAREWHRQKGNNIVDHRKLVKLVNHVPPCLGKPCSGPPLLGDASAASGRRWTPFFGRLLRARDLDFHTHDELHFGHLTLEEAIANIVSQGFSDPSEFGFVNTQGFCRLP